VSRRKRTRTAAAEELSACRTSPNGVLRPARDDARSTSVQVLQASVNSLKPSTKVRAGGRHYPVGCRARQVSARGASSHCGGGLLLWGRVGRSAARLSAVRAIASDATPRPYNLASIATSAESNNVANSGDSLVSRACLTQDLTRLRDPYGQGAGRLAT
jgi:hypothetical protein